MISQSQYEQILKYLKQKNSNQLKKILREQHPVDIAELYEEFSLHEGLQLFSFLDFDMALQVLEEVDPDKKYFILTNIKSSYASRLLNEMSSDDVADFLGEIDDKYRNNILSLLGKEEKKDITGLLSYDKTSAGGIMTTEYIAFPKDLKAGEALNKLEYLAPGAETVYYLYAIDSKNRLVGVISLRDLIVAPEDTPIDKIMWTDVKKVKVSTDQEDVARLIQKYGFLALPVVDDDEVLLGIITVDDVMTIVEEETTEDILKLAGSDSEEKVLPGEHSPWTRAKRRLPWILIAVIGELLSGRVINNFSEALQTIVALAFFIPVLMDMGGNVGTQSAAIVVRGLAIGQIHASSIVKNVLREAAVGLILGGFSGLLIAAVAYIWQGKILLGLVVGIAMAFNLTLAAMLGTFVPLLWHKLGRDPAVASGPLITTILDVLGLFIYFTTATIILKI